MTGSYGLAQDGQSDGIAGDEPTIRGILHDIGHQIMTIALLAEKVRADAALPTAARQQADLVVQETARAVGMITRTARPGDQLPSPATELIDVRELASQAVQLVQLGHQAMVRLLPGPPVYMRVDPMVVWRVLRNIADNAARAAGPGGVVEVSIRHGAGTIIEVTDTGPGFGQLTHRHTAPDTAGLGLSVVRELLATANGRLEISPRRQGGTSVRAVFGAKCDRIVMPRLPGSRVAVA